MSKGISIIMSLIWGFGLVILIKKVCMKDQCIMNKIAPTFNGTITESNKCYRLTKYSVPCN